MLQVQRAVSRPRLRPSWVATLAASGALLAAVAGVVAHRAGAPERATNHGAIVCPIFVDDANALHEEIRRLSLEACLARVEVDRMKLRDACAAGTAGKMACSSGEGQYRMDPCARYQPPQHLDACPFPGSCAR